MDKTDESNMKQNSDMRLKQNVSFIYLYAMILLSPYIFFLLITDNIPVGVDESYQLNSAYRLANGLGYTSCREINIQDLSKTEYSVLKGWPIGYSAAIAFLLKMNVGLETSVKVYRLTSLLISVILWLRIISLLAKSQRIKVLFLSILVPILIFFLNSITDFTLIIFLSGLFLIYGKYQSIQGLGQGDNQGNISIFYIFVTSTLLALAFLNKYLGIAFMLLVILYTILYIKKNIPGKIFMIWGTSILPLITIILVFSFNSKYGGKASFLDSNSAGLFFDFIWIYQIFENIIFDTIQVKTTIYNYFANSAFANYLNIFFVLATFLVVLFMFKVLYSYKLKSPASRFTVEWTLLSYFSILLVTGGLTVLFHPDKKYPVISNARYYWAVYPFIIFITVNYFDNLILKFGRNKFKAIFFIITVLSICFSSVYLQSSYKSSNKFYEQRKVVTSVMSKTLEQHNNATAVVFANSLFKLTLWEDYLPTYRTTLLENNAELYFSEPTIIFLVLNKEEYKEILNYNSISPNSPYLKMNMRDTSHLYLLWREFPPGKLFAN